MRIVVDDGRTERELEVVVEDRDATIAQLLRAAGVDPPDEVTTAGRVVSTGTTVAAAAMPEGSVVRLGHHPPPLSRTHSGAVRHHVAVVAGVAAGTSVPLDRAIVVGRDHDCDLVLPSTTVSPRHCRVLDDGRGGAVVTDLSSRHGTWVDGEQVSSRDGGRVRPGAVIRCGATALRVEQVDEDPRPRSLDPLRHLTSVGTVPFNRPPRPGPPPATSPIEPLPPKPSESSTARFDVVAVVAPLILGGVMVMVMRDLRFALFMLLSPLLMVLNAVGERRRARRDVRRAARVHRAAVARFVAEVTAAHVAETDRSWQLVPSLATVCRRGAEQSVRLWERRSSDPDQLVLGLGIGSVPYRPVLGPAADGADRPTVLARRIIAAAPCRRDAPVQLDLARGGVVGIVGDRRSALALARSLVVQAAVLHGPADVGVAGVVDEHAVGRWSWLPWLPHSVGVDPDDSRLLAAGTAASDALATSLLADGRRRAADDDDRSPAQRTLLVVVDSVSALRGRDAPVRALLRGEAGPVAGIVVAPAEDELPSVCDTVVTCSSTHGDARLVRPAERTAVDDLLIAGLSEPQARGVARRLAGLEDPELPATAAELPRHVDLVDLLDDPHELDKRRPVTAASVRRWWDASADAVTVTTPIGIGPDGPVVLDLDTDGPHGLFGGTTGAGKSELLRSVVAGLAARHHPDRLTFVLVDYKGGAAFDACAELPHVVGLVTDLDEHLGERALRSLEAELRHRERRLRRCRVSDLRQWSRLPPAASPGGPLPRLVVVVDEFAALRAELPDFVEALVSIAQRGRSLGVHLLLATQRPSGAVDQDVRANSNLRIALRVTDRQDSIDVVGVPDAARIPPSRPGRAVVRIGPGAVTPIQTALVTGAGRGGRPSAVRVQPLRPVTPPSSLPGRSPPRTGRTDLDRLVAACTEQFVRSQAAPPRRPWRPPLPSMVPLDRLALDPAGSEGHGPAPVLPMALVDVPSEQAQRTTGWDPTRGPLLVHGVVGSGTTTTAAAAVLAASARTSPDDLHVHVIDLGGGRLAPLAALPHVGSVVTGREQERRRRLLRWLVDEGANRRRLDGAQLAGEPRLLVVVDGFDQLLDELDEPARYDEQEALLRFVAGAAASRISCLMTTTRVGRLRSSLTAAVEQRWALRLASAEEVALLGLRPADVPDQPPGRAVRVADGRVLQIGHPGPLEQAVARVVGRWPSPTRVPTTVGVLPTVVSAAAVASALRAPAHGAWQLPVGIAEDDLAVATLPLHPREHAVLLGPPGSGRSSALGAVAEVADAGGLDVVVAHGSAEAPPWSSGRDVLAPGELAEAMARRAAAERPLLVLVDDADRIELSPMLLEQIDAGAARTHLVCAARPGPVQVDFRHWLRRVARARVGVVLGPVDDAAGDLLGARVPRRAPSPSAPGRGWMVAGGEARFVQLATPTVR